MPQHHCTEHMPDNYTGTLQGKPRVPVANAQSNHLLGKLLHCPPSWALRALQCLHAWLSISPALSWGAGPQASLSSHSDLCLLPLIPESCLVDLLGLATSTMNKEGSIGSFPQHHHLPSFLFPSVARSCQHTIPLCQHVGAKNAVVLFHLFDFFSPTKW